MELISFILVSIGIIMIPGPNVLVVVSNSLQAGFVGGLKTIMGTSAAMIIQLLVAALSTTWFVSYLADGFFWLKWIGVCYLTYVGLSVLLTRDRLNKTESKTTGQAFWQGFWISLTNPKTILFFSAFLPQFVSSESNYLQQIAVLSAVFWVIALVLDSAYAFFAGRLGAYIHQPDSRRRLNWASGGIYLVAATLLARANIQNP